MGKSRYVPKLVGIMENLYWAQSLRYILQAVAGGR